MRHRVDTAVLDKPNIQALIKQLREDTAKQRQAEAEVRMRRSLCHGLILKLLHAGLSTRHVGQIADLSSPAVSQIRRAWEVERHPS